METVLEISVIMQPQDRHQQKEWPSAIWKSVVLKVAGTKRSVMPSRAYFVCKFFVSQRKLSCVIISLR